ncbi:MAG: hypothetical protein K2P51_03345 [Rhabdochlamydiaceae bacterium]|nr:hypothetical protein [Rhabdochlamydiaceae bacterium]
MNDFQKPIHRDDPAPFGQIRVNEIQEDKKGRDQPYDPQPFQAKPLNFAILVSFFKKFLDLLPLKKRAEDLVLEEQKMFEDVISFRKLLQILAQEDQSHNPEFTQQLSELWHNLIDDCNMIRGAPGNLPESINKLKNFMSDLSNYPPGADHTLGYYFAESAGQDWIPFPFMELLESLHNESLSNPPQATLTRWLSALTDILHV